MLLSNWGNFPAIEAELHCPADLEAVRRCVRSSATLIARGNGRCYGDAALATRVLDMRALCQIIEFDRERGEIECEAGVLLADLLPLIVPAGWFFEVTPGTKYVSLGGAIAADVHGKNHPAKGCFSNHLLFLDLMQADGSILRCSPYQRADLFWNTCGGMGWTGVIVRARFRLRSIQSTQMTQKVFQATSVAELLDLFEHSGDDEYAAAWLDLSRRHFGRSLLFVADHVAADTAPDLEMPQLKPAFSVPFFAPHGLLNKYSIAAYNQVFWQSHKNKNTQLHFDPYFYPLDRIGHWNRLYGHRGFVQYQCCLPQAVSAIALREILNCLQKSPCQPFLSVLKRHGKRPASAIHSFPIEGYSLALDFPRTRHLPDLIQVLDDIVWAYDGRIYLAKDSCSAPKMSRIDPQSFGQTKFWSVLRTRISGANGQHT